MTTFDDDITDMKKSNSVPIRNAILYLRFSTVEQADGTSELRQTQMADRWCKENGAERSCPAGLLLAWVTIFLNRFAWAWISDLRVIHERLRPAGPT